MEPTNSIKDASDAVKGIVEAVPVYEDLLQPAVQELGKGLHTVSKTVHIALSPISAMVWGYDQIKEFIQSALETKLEHVPVDNIIVPDISIAGPTIESLRFTSDKEELREMFTNLLATAMNKEEASNAHPAYVEIIRQLTPDEAKILKYIKADFFPLLSVAYKEESSFTLTPVFNDFSDISEKSGCEYPIKISAYLDNLKRLGLIEFHGNSKMNDKEKYDSLKNHEIIKHHYKIAELFGQPIYTESCAQTTVFGKIFYLTCIK